MAIKKFAYLFLLFFSNLTFSQCFEIQSILVDACDSGSATSDEGYNEMVRFQIGTTALNTSNLTVNWPSNTWQGLIQNATTAAKVAQLNSDIIAAGGCGVLLEPTGGVLPANAPVILVTSQNFSTTANSFGALTTTTYIIFQNNTSVTGGHFGNYNATPATRTLTIDFGSGCSDTVTYQRSNLVNIFGVTGGTSAENNGSTVNFTASGVANYSNNGCIAPIQPFTVDAGISPLSACPGQQITLNGTAQGQTTIAWSSTAGNFGTPSALTTTYTVPVNAVLGSTLTLTLSNTNSCNTTITDQISINVVSNIVPTFTQIAAICSGSALLPLPTTSTNGITGTWSPAINNTATTLYTFTPDAGQCASTATMTITVDSPAILHITKDDPNCNPNQLSWSSVNTISPTVATTTLGTNTITITKPSGGLFSTTNVFNGSMFPAQYNLPINSTTLANDAAGLFTFCYNTPVVNPQIAISSIGNSTTPVTINTSVPYQVIWAGPGVTFTNNQTLVGVEGNCIIVFPGTHQCISFDYLTAENYCNVVFGSQDSNCQIDPICEGESVTLAAHGSSNITWSPTTGLTFLPNNKVAAAPTTTTTYTITSNGACQNQASITVTVNPRTLPTFNPVAAICAGEVLMALPTTSLNGITGLWSPALDNTTTTTYTFTPNAGQCASTASLTITVVPQTVPSFNPVAAICAGDVMTALPTTSINGITGSWSPVLDNTSTTTYTFTPTAGQCATTAQLTINVNPLVAPVFTQVAPVCAGSTLAALPTTSNNGITGLWSPALDNTATTTYTFTPDAGQCALTANMTITINPIITPSFTQIQPICVGNSLTALPTTSNNGITGSWSPALNNTATTTYTFTPDAGQCAVTTDMTIAVIPNSTPNFTQVQPICSGNPLAALPTTSNNGITGTWSPSINNTITTTYTFTPDPGQCAATANMTIDVTPRTIPTFTQVAPICIGSTLSSLPTTSNNGITGSWSPALNNTATTLYTFTPDTGQCVTNATMTIVVHPLPTVTPSVTSQSFCSGGTTNINLTSDVPGATFSWTATATTITGHSGSVTGSGATSINQTLVLNPNILTPGQVTYVIVAEANGCLGAPVTVVVTVNPIPNVVVAPTTQTICSGQATSISFSGAINNTVFTWNVLSSVGVSGALNGTGNAINQILTTTGLSQGTVVYEVTPSLNGCVGTPQTITVTVNPVPELFGSATHPELCSGESTFISVSTFSATTVFNWVVEPFGVSGASAGSATGSSILIEQALSTTGTTQGYVDYIITPVLSACAGTPITVRVYVNPLPVVSLTDGTICVDAAGVPFQTYLLDSGLDNANYDFVWTFDGTAIPNATQATYSAAEVGTYTVVATNSTTNCVSNIASAVVTATNPATSLTVTQSDYFSDNATLTVTVAGGNGTLLYQLDAGILQESNVFTGVSGGSHTITVVDTQGCTYLTQEVLIIDYPRYFTPNGDGHNDTWNILGLNQPDAKLFIFDRYGKLIKQIVPSSSSSGWDGTYNNAPMPSTDYWFTLDYTENGVAKQFKAHFSLKR